MADSKYHALMAACPEGAEAALLERCVADERERCAKIAENATNLGAPIGGCDGDVCGPTIAEMIRNAAA